MELGIGDKKIVFKTLAVTFYILLLWTVFKMALSKHVVKEDVKVLERKLNEHGPFYRIGWRD